MKKCNIRLKGIDGSRLAALPAEVYRVYRPLAPESEDSLAAKVTATGGNELARLHAQQEYDFLQRVAHPNIVPLTFPPTNFWVVRLFYYTVFADGFPTFQPSHLYCKTDVECNKLFPTFLPNKF